MAEFLGRRSKRYGVLFRHRHPAASDGNELISGSRIANRLLSWLPGCHVDKRRIKIGKDNVVFNRSQSADCQSRSPSSAILMRLTGPVAVSYIYASMPIIPVDHVQQTEKCWCWAACCEMFLSHYDVRYDQATAAADLAQLLKGGMGSQNPKDTWGSHDEIKILIRKKGIGTDKVQGSPTFGEVCAMLGNNRLIIADIGKHSVLISGYDKDTSQIWVHDPYRENVGRAEYQKFRPLIQGYLVLSQSSIHALD